MNDFFLDSSALVKRYIVESGTAWVLEVLASDPKPYIVVAQIAPVEVVSAFMRRMREGLLQEHVARELRVLINLHASAEYQVTALTVDVIRLAQDLLQRHALRASDAIQLASALQSSQRLVEATNDDLKFVSVDARLLSAAAREGLTILDPTTQA